MHPNQKVYLYKRTNGIYYIGDEVDGKRRWKSTGTENKPISYRQIQTPRV